MIFQYQLLYQGRILVQMLLPQDYGTIPPKWVWQEVRFSRITYSARNSNSLFLKFGSLIDLVRTNLADVIWARFWNLGMTKIELCSWSLNFKCILYLSIQALNYFFSVWTINIHNCMKIFLTYDIVGGASGWKRCDKEQDAGKCSLIL